jgi:hypothetical protein
MSVAKTSNPSPSHPLVGTWGGVQNPVLTTTVTYTVRIRKGCFYVSGLDEDNGVALRISNISWDGEILRFVILYPPTKHKARHDFLLRGKARLQ